MNPGFQMYFIFFTKFAQRLRYVKDSEENKTENNKAAQMCEFRVRLIASNPSICSDNPFLL